jgi:hypothetical protein
VSETLPIEGFRDQIVGSSAPYLIVEAETGAGKTIKVPQWYLEMGERVLVTEPLVETVLGTSEYVAATMGVQLGTTVGYRTGKYQNDSPRSRILFCTTGLALVRELAGHNQFDILVLDELHEWSLDQETLEAWAWLHLQEGSSPFKRIVVLSATMDVEELSRKRGNAPIIRVPGRQFPIEVRPAGASIEKDVITLVNEGHDVLVFQPGKAEIEETILQLERMRVAAELIPFHGGLSRTDKDRAYESYRLPKVVVSTNALETGRTLPPSPGRILAVVDSGMERKMVLKSGVEVMVLASIAQSQSGQRRGRSGRVGPGIYIDHCPVADRPSYPEPGIKRARLDQVVLRLAAAGYDASQLPFFHQPDHNEIATARRSLYALGAFDSTGEVIEMGRQIARLPVSVQGARMLIEAERRRVVGDIVTIVAQMDEGGITLPHKDRETLPPWMKLCAGEVKSDHLAQLSIWRAALGMSSKELRAHGISEAALARVNEHRQTILDALEGKVSNLESSGNRQDILLALCAGMVDFLFQQEYGSSYRGPSGGGVARNINRDSVVGRPPKSILGRPVDIQYLWTDRRSGETYKRVKHLLTMVTEVEVEWLLEVAPQLVSREPKGFRYAPSLEQVVFATDIQFNGQSVAIETSPASECPEATLALANALAQDQVPYSDREYNKGVVAEVNRLRLEDYRIEGLSRERLARIFVERLGAVYLVDRLSQVDLRLELSEFVPNDLLEAAIPLEPETIVVDGVICLVTYHKGWSRQISATVQVPLAQAAQLRTLPELPHAFSVRIEVLDEGGRVVATCGSLSGVREQLQRIDRERRKQEEIRQRVNYLDELLQQCEGLAAVGREVSSLRRKLVEARLSVQISYGYSRTSEETVRQRIREAERELKRLSQYTEEDLLDDLIAGRIQHPDVEINVRVLRQLDAILIRSGDGAKGLIDPVTENDLRDHYRCRIEGTTRIDEMRRRNLALVLSDLVPFDLLDEMDLAPEKVELVARKGTATYPIEYGFEELDGERVAVGIITVPISAYERNCAETGHPSTFPRLPHSIRLIIEVMEESVVVARGEDGERLKVQIKKHQRAKKRGERLPVDELGLRERYNAEVPPPWYVRRR